MNKLLSCLLICFSSLLINQATAADAQTTDAEAADPAAATHVKLETNLGDIVIELNTEKAPKTVNNFLAYVNSGFYDGLIFHRVINGFMIQGGGFSADMNRKSTQPAIENESDNGLSNVNGSIAMARTSAPHSATAQFFINVNNNRNLDYASGRWGYAVFGQVVEGMSVVNQIKQVSTTSKGGYRDVPANPVIINKAAALP